MAIDQRRPHGETIIHSDQGTQFNSWAFTRRAVVLEPNAGRADGPEALEHPGGTGQRVRGSASTNTGSVSPRIRLHRSQDTPEPPSNSGQFSPHWKCRN